MSDPVEPRGNRSTAEFDRRCWRLASGLCLAGGVSVLVGIPLQWSPSSPTGDAFSRSPGYLGPSVAAAGSLLVVAAVVCWFRVVRPNLLLALIPSLCITLVVTNSMGSLTPTACIGYFLCMGGAGLGVLAAIVLAPTEHPQLRRSGPPGSR